MREEQLHDDHPFFWIFRLRTAQHERHDLYRSVTLVLSDMQRGPSFVQSIGDPCRIAFPHRRHLPAHFVVITTIVAASDSSQKQMVVGRS
jgi:hypothetical protein